MIRFKVRQTGKLTSPNKVLDLDLVQARLAAVSNRRAHKFAAAMGDGLRSAAQFAEETLVVNGEITPSFSSIKEDADHIQFVALEGSHSQVGDRVLTEVEVAVAETPTPSGRDPEVVVQAFEFGSAAWGIPVTAFSRSVIEAQRTAAKQDLEEVVNTLK